MSPTLESKKDVLEILEGLQGLEPLKELFWTRLSYHRVNQPLSRRGWGKSAKNALAEDPILWASGGEGGAFHVIYAQLASDRLPLGMERPVVTTLLREHPYALFVFSNDAQACWHFLNVKYDDDATKRQLFRRITIGPEERLRTASERIAMLDLDELAPDLLGLSPLAIQERHDEAFDVEKVTKKFYKDYAATFENVEALIPGDLDQTELRMFTQTLFNRLMFLRFVERKGWLTFEDRTDYLNALHNAGGIGKRSLYRSRIRPLFFEGLAREGAKPEEAVGHVPFLNGGLFEESALDKRVKDIPDQALRPIIGDDGLLYHYNFTIRESTPLDVEVAVDPEMLGKVFEELVTGRHGTGSYYTPRPIVAFMCREAIKRYLEGRTECGRASMDALVDEHDVRGISAAQAGQVIEALDTLKAVDPACGSGAYLLGLLQELFALYEVLLNEKVVGDERSRYDLRLHIISYNLYGVDIDPFAVNIAMLRLWLSLAVESESPVPLPNLDFKIEAGDSLLGPSPEAVADDILGRQVLHWARGLVRQKDQYLKAHGQMKEQLREAILKQERKIARESKTAYAAEDVVYWSIQFAEVFAREAAPGFDIVLANPPYVRQELIRPMKPVLKDRFPDLYAGTADLFTYFFGRGMELMREGGQLVFICSSTWTKTAAAKRLRDFLRDRATVHRFVDFGDLPVFENVTTYPAIIIAEKARPPKNHEVRANQVKTILHSEVEKELHAPGILVPQRELDSAGWRFEDRRVARLRQKIRDAGVPLKDIVNGQIYRGILTGLNEAFVVDQQTRDALVAADPRSEEILKPFLEGKDLKPWRANWRGLWLIRIPAGWTNRAAKKHFTSEQHAFAFFNKQYPAVADWLSAHAVKARKRCDQGDWYWELRACAYYNEFDKRKIMYPHFVQHAKFSFDRAGFYSNDKSYIIPHADFYLLALLNSPPLWFYLKGICSIKAGGFYESRIIYLETFPIAQAGKADARKIAALAEALSAEDCPNGLELEAELNDRVATLYGLTADEIKLVGERARK